VHRSLRRFAALLFFAVPVSLLGRGGAWVAAHERPLPARAPHDFALTPLAIDASQEERSESAVVLVVLDGVRWQEVFGGADRELARRRGLDPLVWANARDLVPNLQRMLDADAVAIGAPGHGPEMTASGPRFISLPGYLEIFGGRPDPGCESNECQRSPAHTIADDVRDSSGADDVAVVTSWPNIARAVGTEASRYVMTAGRKLLARAETLRDDPETAAMIERASQVKAWPGEGDYRPDAYTAALALRVLVTERPRFLFVGLGDADEFGHRNDYRRYLDAIHRSDGFLGQLEATLAGMGARGQHTTVLVTVDHGRAYSFREHGARYPESGRVWFVAAGGDVHSHGLLHASRRHTLSDVAPTVRALLGIAGDGLPIDEVLGNPAPLAVSHQGGGLP
jgi:hypothetical protein